MTPAFAANNTTGLTIANTIATAKFSIGQSVTGKFAHFAHARLCDFGHAVEFAASAGVFSATSFFYHVLHIVRRCAYKQVSRVATRRVVTMMANKQTIRYRPICKFVGHNMRPKRLVISATRNAITRVVSIRLPLPAIIGATAIHSLPKSIGRVLERLMMAKAELSMLALNQIAGNVGGVGNWRCLPAAAHAKPGRVGSGSVGPSPIVPRNVSVMTVNEPEWFVLGVSAPGFSGKRGFVSATAMTIAVWIFRSIGCIIGHTDISLLDVGHVSGRSNVADTLSYPHYCSTDGCLCKYFGGG